MAGGGFQKICFFFSVATGELVPVAPNRRVAPSFPVPGPPPPLLPCVKDKDATDAALLSLPPIFYPVSSPNPSVMATELRRRIAVD